MKRCCRLSRLAKVTSLLLIVLTIFYTVKDSAVDVQSLYNTVENLYQVKKTGEKGPQKFNIARETFQTSSMSKTTELSETFDNSTDHSPQNLMVHSEQWIIVDGTHVPKEDILKTQGLTGWMVLIFGKNIRNYKNKQCTSCIFIRGPEDMAGHLFSIPVPNLKMAVYLFAILHGAKWIYVTSHLTNLKSQLDGFDFGTTSEGLLYEGQVTFDPDRHFGVKDVSDDFKVRKHLSYTLGDHLTPSIQSRWTPPKSLIRKSGFDIRDVSCRLPRLIVPSKFYPVSELSESLIEQRSFWVLGSLIGDTSSWAQWWISLMRDLGDVIGSYPPSCTDSSHIHKNVNMSQDIGKKRVKCKENMSFYDCGKSLAKELQKRNLFTSSDVNFVQTWFKALSKASFKEPQLQKRRKEPPSIEPIHQVAFAQGRSNIANPFKNICKSPPPKTSAPINDILLVVIFNFPTYYSNIASLNFIYRQYFTNIVYCGSVLGNFTQFQKTYPHPVSFLEVNEIRRGAYGYMCTANAMEMGYRVKGYLQMSDDVLLNAWNIHDLPRDRIWFQGSIRKGKLTDRTVPNITPLTEAKTWWPWASTVGVGNLRKLWKHFRELSKTPEKLRVDSFLDQLSRSFGKDQGAFYEASDVFYVPAKFQENFSFFSRLFLAHNLHLEIAVPTMLCGLDDIKNIVRLKGRYLWFKERYFKSMIKAYNDESHFLHPCKLQPLMVTADGRKFFCTKYFSKLGKSVKH